MNYQDQELRQALASEYVLGTLTGAARRRFEQLMQDDAELRELVAEWEQKLGKLHEGLEPVTPPAQTWENIQRRLGVAGQAESPGWINRFWSSLMLWRSLTTATTAALAFAIYLNWFTPTLVVNQYVAVISNEQQQASWLVSSQPQQKQLVIHVLKEQTLPLGKAFELWMLPEGDSVPVSMGLVSPTDNKTIVISEAVLTRLSNAKGLAVSLEPDGGSPTGQPTGPVLYQGRLQSL